MPSTRDIRRRIRSIKNTAQITKAMQMVAASKMRKAQQAALAGRPYAALFNHVVNEVTAYPDDFTHPLLVRGPDDHQQGVLLISADKGLCGALNSNLMREAAKFDRAKTVYITAGKRAGQFIARAKRRLVAEFTFKDAPLISEARAISKFAQDLFLKGEVSRIDIVYTRFVNTLTQRPEVIPFLPVGQLKALEVGSQAGSPEPERTLPMGATEFLFEPSASQVFGALLPHYLNFRLYQILLEAKASEHSARMVAMKNATDNALQLIKDLTLEYNKLRQASITKELLEITTATMAMQ